jgi:hypothetical protein
MIFVNLVRRRASGSAGRAGRLGARSPDRAHHSASRGQYQGRGVEVARYPAKTIDAAQRGRGKGKPMISPGTPPA